MISSKLHADSDFLVKESSAINLMAGAILCLVFVVSMLVSDGGWGNFLSALSLLILPAGFYLARAKRNTTIIKINKTGFYYAGKFVANWQDFIEAKVEHILVPGSIQDNYVLLFRFYNDTHTLIYTQTIPLTNTQDKVEEEIIAAIDFFYKSSTSQLGKQYSDSQATW